MKYFSHMTIQIIMKWNLHLQIPSFTDFHNEHYRTCCCVHWVFPGTANSPPRSIGRSSLEGLETVSQKVLLWWWGRESPQFYLARQPQAYHVSQCGRQQIPVGHESPGRSGEFWMWCYGTFHYIIVLCWLWSCCWNDGIQHIPLLEKYMTGFKITVCFNSKLPAGNSLMNDNLSHQLTKVCPSNWNKVAWKSIDLQ